MFTVEQSGTRRPINRRNQQEKANGKTQEGQRQGEKADARVLM